MWDFLGYIISVVTVWSIQRSLLKKCDRVPSSVTMIFLVILLFVPAVNFIVTILVWALSYFVDKQAKLAKFYNLEKHFERKERING